MFSIPSNVHTIASTMRKAGAGFLDEMDAAVGDNAKMFLKACIIKIDEKIYSQPPASTYGKGTGRPRTKFLRRSHHIKRLDKARWLLWNDARYAIYQHEGWTDKSGKFHPGRPWMREAIEQNMNVARARLREPTARLFHTP